ncbi:MAG: TRAP transporter large permease subunit [Deltaproteobacteria bacterium]|nr:TRAP transporter large permease subunit [Deltaproteobacteria bacterium]
MDRSSFPVARSTGKAINHASAVLGYIGGGLMALCAFVVTYDVITRYLFRSPTGWAFEISILMMLMAVFLTVSYGLKEGAHVRVELVFRMLPENARKIFEIISSLFVLCYAVIFSRHGLMMVIKSVTRSETTDFLGLPVWPVKAVFLAAFVVLAFQTFSMLVTRCYLLLTGPRFKTATLSPSILTVLLLIIVLFISIITGLTLNPTLGLIVLLLVVLAAGIPISFSLGIVAAIGFIGILGIPRGLDALPQVAYWVWDGFTVMALPLFIFVGNIMYRSGLSDELFKFARAWLGHLPGGLAIAALAACAIFSAISGSSVVNAATIGLVAIPAMVAYGYDKRIAAGVVAAGGTMGILIPPSTAMILIGISADESIGHLFIAGIMPGILVFVLLSIGAVIIVKRTGTYQPLPKVSLREKLTATRVAIGSLILPIIIMGGIYSGAFTPTEAASVAVVYALGFALFIKKIKWTQLLAIMKDSTKTVAMAAILLAGGIALGKVVAMLQVTQDICAYFVTAGWPGWMVIIAITVLVLILGMFLDGSAICLLVIPILAPIIRLLGYDMLWFAVLFTINTEIGLITPPIGMNVFIIQQVSDIDAHEVLRGAIPFLFVLVIALLVVAFFPAIATWLPGTMG